MLKIPHYQKDISVSEQHIDRLGHVNNTVYLNWLLEMASEHWQRSAPKVYQNKYRWVVRRHEIDYLKPAYEGETLMATTWVDEMGGVQSLRRVQLKRGNELIMNALTRWILIDAKTGKLARIPADLIDLYLSY